MLPQLALLRRPLLLILALLLAAAEAKPEGLSLHGRVFTLEDIDSGTLQLTSGAFIASVHEQEMKEPVLQSLKDKFGWEPKNRFSDKMPLFSGDMTAEVVRWLLESDHVRSIENDGKVHAVVKEKEL